MRVEEVELYPELYFVPEEAIEAERRQPGSQPRLANENVPLLWTQSLTWLADLLLAGLLLPEDLDPSQRRRSTALGASEVLVALVPEDAAISAALAQAGLPLSSPIGSPRVDSSRELGLRMAAVGANDRLGISGHPRVRMETMATARLYSHRGELIGFLPAVLEEDTFYLADDPLQLVDAVAS